jgi:hypothetical protein
MLDDIHKIFHNITPGSLPKDDIRFIGINDGGMGHGIVDKFEFTVTPAMGGWIIQSPKRY